MVGKLALLDASLGDTPAERNFRREFDVELDVFKVSEGAFPDVSAAGGYRDFPYDGAVISGSQTSVYWDEPWIDDVEGWVQDAVDCGVPVLGVCWGHQLLAAALGGTVSAMDDYELGYRTVRQCADSDLFAGISEEFVAFETHSDVVSELPPGATRLAENDCCVQAFRVRNAVGVQFHPEYDRDTARWVTENKRGEVDDERVDAVLSAATASRHAETAQVTRLFENFQRFARDRASLSPEHQ
ncbi:type 1 glutamine amidotransferase [Halorientalis brevis]|uniref:Type 1 glutamine amidotransferase n=1 Tax=Halorientalis brevis TaxID=1126241 RepID=A0ABD6CBB1_9EURY|nr:type 1 glutamine amidotransferase [Halorientalis brevis]